MQTRKNSLVHMHYLLHGQSISHLLNNQCTATRQSPFALILLSRVFEERSNCSAPVPKVPGGKQGPFSNLADPLWPYDHCFWLRLREREREGGHRRLQRTVVVISIYKKKVDLQLS